MVDTFIGVNKIVDPDSGREVLTDDIVDGSSITTETGTQTLEQALDSRLTESDLNDRPIFTATVSGLKALDITSNQASQEFSVTTGSGHGSFIWVPGDQSVNVSSDPLGGIWVAPDSDATGASGAYRRNYWIGDGLRAEWFGVGEGTTDNGPPVSAAIDYADTSGVQVVRLPAGSLDIGTKVSWQHNNISLCGAGSEKTKLNVTYTADDVISVGDGVTEVTGTRIEGISINAAAAMTAGWAVRLQKTGRTTLDDVIIAPQGETINVYNGIQFAEFDNVMVGRVLVRTLNDGIEVYGETGQGYGAEIVFGNMTRVIGCGRYGLHIGGSAGGVKLGDLDIISSGTENVRISTELSTEHNREIFFSSLCTIDSCGANCIRILDNSFEHIDMSGTWVASGGQTSNDQGGINVSATQRNQAFLKMTGLRVYNHNGPGIAISGGRFLLSGSVVRNCGLTSTSLYDGVSIENANANRFLINGCDIIDNGNNGNGVGVRIRDAATDNFVISSCVLLGNQAGAIANPTSASATRIIANNVQ